jgi:hypothetical protein
MNRQLIVRILFCALLAPAGKGAELDILQRGAEAALREVAALSALACTEQVVESKFDQKRKLEEQRRQAFDYFVMVETDDGDVSVTESRIEQGVRNRKERMPLLISTGFATMMLILHPYYRDSFHFTDLGVEQDSGRSWRRVGFEFISGKKSPGVLRVGTREYPLSWTGELLIDEPGGHVGMVRAHLGAPLEDIGLSSLAAEVRYGPANLEPAASEWLPLSATVDLTTRRQHWRNTHTFSNYKRFEVTAVEKKGQPE